MLLAILVSAKFRRAMLLISLCATWHLCRGQGLSPRAYVIVPIHTNAVTFTYSLQDGNVVFDQTLPISNSKGRIGAESVSCFHTFDFFGRSANLNAFLPYAVGHFQADVSGTELKVYRSGLAPTGFRLSINLHGAPAMTATEFRKW